MCIDMASNNLMWFLILANVIAFSFLVLGIISLVRDYVKHDLEQFDYSEFKKNLTKKNNAYGND